MEGMSRKGIPMRRTPSVSATRRHLPVPGRIDAIYRART
jgi:hypothetical protein